MPANTLASLQSMFYQLVTAPSGVRTGLSSVALDEAALTNLVRGDERLGAVDRLDLYANMYFFRILDVLRDDYARLVQVVGDAPFHNLITDYLLACPPHSWTLRNAGDRLAAFVAQHPSGQKRPWLSDLARLERSRLEVFDAAEAEVLTMERVRAMRPEAYAALLVRTIPAHARIDVDYEIEPIWKVPDADATPRLHRHPVWIWRQETMVFHRPMTDVEAQLYPELSRGVRFDALCETIDAAWPERDAATQAFELLARLVEEGLLIDTV